MKQTPVLMYNLKYKLRRTLKRTKQQLNWKLYATDITEWRQLVSRQNIRRAINKNAQL